MDILGSTLSIQSQSDAFLSHSSNGFALQQYRQVLESSHYRKNIDNSTRRQAKTLLC